MNHRTWMLSLAVLLTTAGLGLSQCRHGGCQAKHPAMEWIEPASPCAPCCVADCYQPVCGPPGKCWARAEYLVWWIQGASLPPLVTESAPGTDQLLSGLLGAPSTTILFGNNQVNEDSRSGGRLTVGTWFDCDHTFGVEASFFILEDQATIFQDGSDSTRQIGRPFTDANTDFPMSELVSFPGVVAGDVAVNAGSSGLVSGEINLRENLYCHFTCKGYHRLDLIGGYRFLRFDETVRITEFLRPLGSIVVPGTTIAVQDNFNAKNEFHGANVGLAGEVRRGRYFVEFLGKLAIGSNKRTVNINGVTINSVPGFAPVVNQGGILALSTNIGTKTSSDTVVIPEFGLNVGMQLNKNTRVFAGYSFLWWMDLARAGDQIDLQVNANLIPPVVNPVGPNEPGFPLRTTDTWVQGINGGVELRY